MSNISSNTIGKLICFNLKDKASFLDNNNILWKYNKDEFIGKRSVFTKDFKSAWIEDVDYNEIKSWWCGKDADYFEIFRN